MSDSAPTPVHAFADRAWEQFLELNPLWATLQGVDRWDDRLDDPGPEGRAAVAAMCEAWEAEMDGFAGLDLSVDDQITLGLIRFAVQRFRGELDGSPRSREAASYGLVLALTAAGRPDEASLQLDLSLIHI